MVNNLPYQSRREVFSVLVDGIIRNDMKGFFLRKEDWMNPGQIHNEVLKNFRHNIDRDRITIFLDECAEHEEKFVERKFKKDQESPAKKKDFVEPKAQREYKITENGIGLLAFMNNPKFKFVSKRF